MTAPQNKPAPDADRPKTLSPADAKRLAALAPGLLKVPAHKTVPAAHKTAKHYPSESGRAFCDTACVEGALATSWSTTTCEQCLALRVVERKKANNASAQRYHERKRAAKTAAAKTSKPAIASAHARRQQDKDATQRYHERKPATPVATPVATKPLHDPAPVPPSVQDDSRHFREAASLDEGHVRPSQIVAAIEVMIASAHARRRDDEAIKRPVDRFVWGQLEALRKVRDLVLLAVRKERV
jgi:hypothetical protein